MHYNKRLKAVCQVIDKVTFNIRKTSNGKVY